MSNDAFLAGGPVWMEPAEGVPDGHGLELSIRPSAGFGPCRCGDSLLIVDLHVGTVRCARAMSEAGDGLLLQTFSAVVNERIVAAAGSPQASQP